MKITMIGRNGAPADYWVCEGKIVEDHIFEGDNGSIIHESSFVDYHDVRLEESEGENQ